VYQDLHTGVIRRDHSTFIFDFCGETKKLEVVLRLWDSIMEIGKIPAGETEI
jgi:hypothetical protein